MHRRTDREDDRPYPRVNEVVPHTARPFLSVEVEPAERDNRIIRKYVKIYAGDIDRVVSQLLELKDILKEKDRAFMVLRPRREYRSENPALTHRPFQGKLSAVRVELQDDPK